MPRARVLFFLLYVTLDFASPWVPGAVNFAPEECVEGVRCHAVRAERPVVTAPGSLPDRTNGLVPERPAVSVSISASGASRVTSWLTPRRLVNAAHAEPAPSSDDH